MRFLLADLYLTFSHTQEMLDAKRKEDLALLRKVKDQEITELKSQLANLEAAQTKKQKGKLEEQAIVSELRSDKARLAADVQSLTEALREEQEKTQILMESKQLAAGNDSHMLVEVEALREQLAQEESANKELLQQLEQKTKLIQRLEVSFAVFLFKKKFAAIIS